MISTRTSSASSLQIVEQSVGSPYAAEQTMAPITNYQIPHLQRTKNSAQLIVHGKPFLMLPAELHNSSLSSSEYMSTVWQNMKDMNINTLLGSVTWEMIEPEESKFDFNELDKVILGARESGLHLVLLWFGSFKNALSTYVPSWVKTDVKRFPRVHVFDDNRRRKTIELLSPWSKTAMEADGKAFATLMRHLKEVDGQYSTVLMVQVENETGLLGDSRDRSQIADEKFRQPVPEGLLKQLSTSLALHPTMSSRWPNIKTKIEENPQGTWEDIFGEGVAAEEMFMADAFSRYVGTVAAAGKKEYAIPFYANVWLNFDDPSTLDLSGIPLGEGTPTVAGGGAKAGVYPSGGPCPHTFDIWRYNASALDFIAPDLYLHDYEWVCQQYRHQNQPLFVPEQKADAKGARRTWLAYGTYGAIGCSPFGIDTLDAKDSPFTRPYGILQSMSSHVLQAQAERPDEMFGFFFDDLPESGGSSSGQETWTKQIGDFEVIIERSFVFGKPGPGYGMVIHQGEGKFLLIGAGFQIYFRSIKSTSTFTGILSAFEKRVDAHGKLHTVRTFNGDETRSGSFLMMPNEDPDYGGFPIRVTIPAATYIAECTAYSIEEVNE